MVGTTIAVVADCDDTLAPDTTAQLLSKFGVDVNQFWKKNVNSLVEAGFDPPVAYLSEILALVKSGPLASLTEGKLKEIGRELVLYPGVPEVFSDLRKEIERDPRYHEHRITVEYYIVSGGIKDLIQASPLGEAVYWIWGCNFGYDGEGRPVTIRRVVSFTDKTRFLFNIQKGYVGQSHRNMPYSVNAPMEEQRRPIPLRNMLYLGDGPSDIPCMSLVMKNEGCVVGVACPEDTKRSWAMAYGRRAHATVEPDYRAGTSTYKTLKEALNTIANRIVRTIEYERGEVLTPTYV
jgi:hypothetical protein